MNHKLFLIEELEDQDVSSLPSKDPNENQVTLGGEVHTAVACEEGETRRWTRTDHYILMDQERRYWAVPFEVNPTDHDGGAEGFRSHPSDHGNPIYVAAHEVRPVPREITTWEVVK